MDPLVVAGDLREGADAFLRDLVPLRGTDLLADELPQVGESTRPYRERGDVDHLRGCPFRRGPVLSRQHLNLTTSSTIQAATAGPSTVNGTAAGEEEGQ